MFIMLFNQHGDASKPQAEAKGVNTHQAALFASSTQGLSVRRKYEQQDWQALFTSPTQLQALLAATVCTTQRDIERRREQKNQHIGVRAVRLCLRVTSSSTSIASKMLRTTPSSSMEMMQSSFALWTMTLWMANSPARLVDSQASHVNGW